MKIHDIELIDWCALAFFISTWVTYTWYADFSRWSKQGLPKVMNYHRWQWMRKLLDREVRIPDALLMGNFLQSSVFFASTAILIIGGLTAGFGVSEETLGTISILPYADLPTKRLWVLKIIVMICVYIYAFVKFVWAVRLANYTSVLFNAAPLNQGDISEQYADQLSVLAGLFAEHFNQGLRAYFFGLAIMGWWFNAPFFMLATALTIWVLYRREFRSNSLRVINNLMRIIDDQ